MMLEVTTRAPGKVIIVDCRGRIVLGDETGTLRHLINDLMNESQQIVLNLTDVNHIDSNGIGMLFGLQISANRKGVVIKLAGLGDKIKRVAEITKLSTVYEVYPTAEEAAASFEAPIQQTAAS